ncbi:MAG: hypothetical protein V3V16_14205 [Melioribacteraceae bacterium]
MKKIISTLVVLLMISSYNVAQQSTEIKNNKKQHGGRFIDLDGDGYNDNAPDHDGDGIPNGLDPDYRKNKARKFVDLDGDGINDNTGFGKRHRNSLRSTIKNQKDSEQNGVEDRLQDGKEHFNNHSKGFGFENNFGRDQSGKNGTGTFNGPWNWGWRYGNGSGNGNGTGDGDGGTGVSNGPWNRGWGRGHGGG